MRASSIWQTSWKREGGQIVWEFTVPANTSPELRLRTAGGEALADGKIIRFLRNESGLAVFDCRAGTHSIRIPNP